MSNRYIISCSCFWDLDLVVLWRLKELNELSDSSDLFYKSNMGILWPSRSSRSRAMASAYLMFAKMTRAIERYYLYTFSGQNNRLQV